jgi:hypothetical protein
VQSHRFVARHHFDLAGWHWASIDRARDSAHRRQSSNLWRGRNIVGTFQVSNREMAQRENSARHQALDADLVRVIHGFVGARAVPICQPDYTDG